MSAWKIGDLAVCIDDSPCACCGDPLGATKGAYYRISEIDMLMSRMSSEPMLGFAFEGVDLCSPNHMFCAFVSALRFRKITKASAKFTAKIRACRDAHSPAPVA